MNYRRTEYLRGRCEQGCGSGEMSIKSVFFWNEISQLYSVRSCVPCVSLSMFHHHHHVNFYVSSFIGSRTKSFHHSSTNHSDNSYQSFNYQKLSQQVFVIRLFFCFCENVRFFLLKSRYLTSRCDAVHKRSSLHSYIDIWVSWFSVSNRHQYFCFIFWIKSTFLHHLMLVLP